MRLGSEPQRLTARGLIFFVFSWLMWWVVIALFYSMSGTRRARPSEFGFGRFCALPLFTGNACKDYKESGGAAAPYCRRDELRESSPLFRRWGLVKLVPPMILKKLRGLVPGEYVHFALVRPFLPARDQSGFDGILKDVKPLLRVALAAAELAIEKILLPNGFFGHARPVARHVRTPEFHPPFEWSDGHSQRSAEQVQLIRHKDVTAD